MMVLSHHNEIVTSLADYLTHTYSPESDHEFDHIIRWAAGNAHGLLHKSGPDSAPHIIATVGGTNDPRDWQQNRNTVRQKLSDWGHATGIPVSNDAHESESTAGFLAHAASAYHGITGAIRDAYSISLTGESMPASIWLGGHSLGGTAVHLLLHTKPFVRASGVSFGSPKTFKRGSFVPTRDLTQVLRISDTITHLPWSCMHGPSRKIYIGYGGSRRATVPAAIRPIVYGYGLLANGIAIAGTICRKLGLVVNYDVWTQHSMIDYDVDINFK